MVNVRLKYAFRKAKDDVKGYVIAEEYDEFYVITKSAYNRAQKRLKGRKPYFLTTKRVHILGVDIS